MRNDLIAKIEIQYFRSIYRIVISNVELLNILTGKNDVGKSNILKALNLFFNNCVEKTGDYVFSENYNLNRLEEVRKESVKGKQFIQIKITFRRGKQSIKSLPDYFTVTKKWNRDSNQPQVSDNLALQMEKYGMKYTNRTKASLTRFLNMIRYIYIPAIKDNNIFDEMIGRLQTTVYRERLGTNEQLGESLDLLSKHISETTKELSEEFESATKVKSSIAPPTEIDILYKTFKITTREKDGNIPLEYRGDGIRVRYLPSILFYIAQNSPMENYIWGFEEPENSLEYNLAKQMAEDFWLIYGKNAQIFMTTHSAAFLDLAERDCVQGFRCYKKMDNDSTGVVKFEEAGELPALAEELGYAAIIKKQFDEYKREVDKNQRLKEQLVEVEKELQEIKNPILLTEGKTDALILKTAWKKLYNHECPFVIKSCDLMGENSENALAGAGILSKALCSVRYDSSNVIIGMFDNDSTGVKEFKLDANYIYNEDKRWKKHKNERGFAFLIPARDNLKEIAANGCLCIEYLFDRDSLECRVDGKGLEIEKAKAKIVIGDTVVGTKSADEKYWFYGKIKESSKTEFASAVVPTLPKEKFENFKGIFEIVLEILEELA